MNIYLLTLYINCLLPCTSSIIPVLRNAGFRIPTGGIPGFQQQSSRDSGILGFQQGFQEGFQGFVSDQMLKDLVNVTRLSRSIFQVRSMRHFHFDERILLGFPHFNHIKVRRVHHQTSVLCASICRIMCVGMMG